VILAEERHFRRAAARLHLTQSALSKQVRKLQLQTGNAPLVDITCRPLQLTAAGREVLTLCRDLLARSDARHQAALATQSGRLVLGLLGGEGASWPARDLLLAAQDAIGGHQVGCRALAFAEATPCLLAGEVDLLIARHGPRREEIAARTIRREPRLLALPRHWPQADAPSLPAAVAAQLPVLHNAALPADEYDFWALGDIRPVREARPVPSQAQSMVDLIPEISRGGAVTIALSASTALHCDRVSLIPLPDAPPVENAICWRNNDRRELTARAVHAIADAFAQWTTCRKPAASCAETARPETRSFTRAPEPSCWRT
jgi:LysR family transcriptional regulator, benzoate and cis,cis-muconate-responsive activator of ben and cat genes